MNNKNNNNINNNNNKKNISAVTEPILTKLFGPNLLGALILVDINSCLDQTSFDQKYFLDQICFLTLISGPNSFLT